MKYRPEIDGLRAVAVAPVILFHAGIQPFSGGFVGVDIFFVISGFLITSIILSELHGQKFSIIRFYERRMRRILPALFLVVGLSIPVAWIVLTPRDLENFFQSVAALSQVELVVDIENMLFWKESGYFDTASEFKPMLHTWSLGVEEQFYIFFPLMLIVTRFWRSSSVAVLIIALSVASFLLGQYFIGKNPSAAFYLLPTRAWELGLGALGALWLRHEGASRMWPKWRHLLSAGGLILIVISIFAYDKQTPFPGIYALVPTLGALLVILFATEGDVAYRILSNRIMVLAGLISYSAYLWHQPIFALTRRSILGEPSTALMLTLSAGVLVLAYLSWRFVETPFRSPRRMGRAAIFTFSIVGSLLLFSLGLAGHFSSGFKSYYLKHRSTPQQAVFLSYLDFYQSEELRAANKQGVCYVVAPARDFSAYDKGRCLSLSAEDPNVLLIGDSHSAHFIYALESVFTNVNFLQASASNCRPHWPFGGDALCKSLMTTVFDDALPVRPKLDAIILSAYWDKDDPGRMKQTIEFMSLFADRVIIIGPNISYPEELPLMLAVSSRLVDAPIERLSLGNPDRFDLDREMRKEVESTGGVYVSIAEALCQDRECQVVVEGSIPMLWDRTHFTPEGAVWAVSHMTSLKSSFSEDVAK